MQATPKPSARRGRIVGIVSRANLLQAQRDLNIARNSELLALVEYAKSVVNYGAVQQAPLFGQ
mgnify:CR=1 FL=1